MPWEPRGKSGKLYFYQSVRSADGRVVKKYVGCGPRAQWLAAEIEARGRGRVRDRDAVGAAAAGLAAADRLADELSAAAGAMTAAAMLAAGYHRPKNGTWRKRRGQACYPAAGAAGRDPAGDRPGPGG